ncbi:MAG: F5/8 type C domain protein [Planctomycetes bacterium ADurb.Bin126]|nr:MAG: F5/8 type C domain protein [Planctomycetes bacterium ADurb.Bin126]HOD81076.1 discoidin domain-containing protein [Phycisphaerae bacterium]HQL73656.1 discoidin domain-containing protein [Phycisphaerae bacterium]
MKMSRLLVLSLALLVAVAFLLPACDKPQAKKDEKGGKTPTTQPAKAEPKEEPAPAPAPKAEPKKEEPAPAPAPKAEPKKEEPAPAPAPKVEPKKEEPAPAPAPKAEATPSDEPAKDTKGLVELKLELPKPLFEGTPKNIREKNLRPPRKGPRDPLMVPPGVTNVASGKAVTSSDSEPIIGELKLVTDGDKEGTDGSYVELGPGKQWVQIDLKDAYNIFAVVVWHYHREGRVYRDVVVQVADDADFITNVRTVFNNDYDNSSGLGIGNDMQYLDSFEGELIPVKGLKARYVRLYSNGNTSNDQNHYTEVEVFGKK